MTDFLLSSKRIEAPWRGRVSSWYLLIGHLYRLPFVVYVFGRLVTQKEVAKCQACSLSGAQRIVASRVVVMNCSYVSRS